MSSVLHGAYRMKPSSAFYQRNPHTHTHTKKKTALFYINLSSDVEAESLFIHGRACKKPKERRRAPLFFFFFYNNTKIIFLAVAVVLLVGGGSSRAVRALLAPLPHRSTSYSAPLLPSSFLACFIRAARKATNHLFSSSLFIHQRFVCTHKYKFSFYLNSVQMLIEKTVLTGQIVALIAHINK